MTECVNSIKIFSEISLCLDFLRICYFGVNAFYQCAWTEYEFSHSILPWSVKAKGIKKWRFICAALDKPFMSHYLQRKANGKPPLLMSLPRPWWYVRNNKSSGPAFGQNTHYHHHCTVQLYLYCIVLCQDQCNTLRMWLNVNVLFLISVFLLNFVLN